MFLASIELLTIVWVVIGTFVIIAITAVLSLLSIVKIQEPYKKWLFRILIAEIAISCVSVTFTYLKEEPECENDKPYALICAPGNGSLDLDSSQETLFVNGYCKKTSEQYAMVFLISDTTLSQELNVDDSNGYFEKQFRHHFTPGEQKDVQVVVAIFDRTSAGVLSEAVEKDIVELDLEFLPPPTSSFLKHNDADDDVL